MPEADQTGCNSSYEGSGGRERGTVKGSNLGEDAMLVQRFMQCRGEIFRRKGKGKTRITERFEVAMAGGAAWPNHGYEQIIWPDRMKNLSHTPEHHFQGFS
jgi:hypothetical protein